MQNYIRLLVVSYATRKILSVKRGHGWELPECEQNGKEIGELTEKLCETMLGQPCNFYIDYECSPYIERIDSRQIRYVWAFYCIEELDKSTVEYQWQEYTKLNVSGSVKEYISSLVYSKIVIKCENHSFSSGELSARQVKIQGSKQAFSRIIPLKILHPEIQIENSPQILDVFYQNEVIKKSKQTEGAFVIDEKIHHSWGITNMLPMLLYKHKKVVIQNAPEGCRIGQRTLDLYLYVMRMFGVRMQFLNDAIVLEYRIENSACEIEIPIFASFTATSMAIYFALLGNGMTVIKNASIEPEILFLLETIEKLGYKVQRTGRTFEVDGNRKKDVSLKQRISVPVDRNILVTRIADAIYEGKEFHYCGEQNLHIDELVSKIGEFGIPVEYADNELHILTEPVIQKCPAQLVFGHFPDLCTDWQPLLTVLCTAAAEEVVIYDKIFNDRYRYIEQLKKIYPGLAVNVFKNLALIKNCNPAWVRQDLEMQHFTLLDIRAAAALIIALSKCSNFYLDNITQLLRGHENLSQISECIGGKYEFQ